MILLGALVNGIAVVIGGLAGTFGGKLLPERIRTALIPTMGLITIGIAVPGLVETSNLLIPILSMVIGIIIGEIINIDSAMNKLGERIQSKMSGGSIAEGFVTCSLVFAIGAMAVMGALDSGLRCDHSVLYAKSIIDLIGAMAFASALGMGVVLSAVSVFVVEGGIALLASLLSDILSTTVVNEITFVGSLILVGIALNNMGATKLRSLNMVPALVMPIILCQFM